MPRKKTVPPAETPENKPMNPAPEAEAPEETSTPAVPEEAVETALEALPQAPEEEPAPAVPEETAETAPEDIPDPPEVAETPPAPSQTPEEAPAPPAPEAAPEPVPEPPEAAPETPPGPDGFPAIVTAAKGLNFRAGPGFGFDVLGVVEFGTLLIVLDLPMGVKVPGWALVWLGQTAAWVSDKHLRLLAD